ncbi:MAG: ShlB/FhaC/HecB family hemolysin secretion/activation protein [Deltaproteobacteria bacterium]|nr:ShlB/FhaC/HecB family hemolysin secretion/activation protein [Deltaproteobacteria bacterium]
MRIAIVIFLSLFLLPPCIFAQEPSGEVLKQLEKKDMLPKSQEPPKPPVIEKQEKEKIKTEAIPKTADLKVFVKTFKIQGAVLLSQATFETITAKYQNKELTLAEINEAVEAITDAYRQKGWLAAYAYIPVQDVKDGIVIIQIIEAKTGAITVTGNKNYTAKFIQGHIEKIKQEPSLNEQTLERGLLLLNDYPSLNAGASLKAGSEAGTTDVNITAQDSYPISGSISYDNFGTKNLSKNRMSLAIDKGNTITDGDNIKLNGITGLDRINPNKYAYGRIEYSAPVDYNGTKAGVYYANSLYRAGGDITPLQIKGNANTGGLYIAHPFIRTAERTLSVRFGLDYKDVKDYLLDSIRSKDKIRVTSLSLSYDATDRLSGRNIISIAWYQGLGDVLDGSGKNDNNLSRLHSNNRFGKATIDLARIQKITKYNQFVIKGSGQWTNDPLFIAEQFSIRGTGSVRGYKPSAYRGDSGYNITAELQLSPISPETNIFGQKLGDTVKIVLFADNGGVYRNDLQPGEVKDDYITGIGAGLRVFYGKNFSVSMDYALPKQNGAYKTSNSQTYLQAVMTF